MQPTVISFFTPDGDWPAHGARLRGECDNLGVPHHIVMRHGSDDWLANCRMKADAIFDAIVDVRGPVLWLDADTSLLAAPTGLDESCDFMGRLKNGADGRTWHVDAMYFDFSESATDLLRSWITHTHIEAQAGGYSDEWAFEQAWQEWTGKWAPLPQEFDDAPGSIVKYRRSRSPSKEAALARLHG